MGDRSHRSPAGAWRVATAGLGGKCRTLFGLLAVMVLVAAGAPFSEAAATDAGLARFDNEANRDKLAFELGINEDDIEYIVADDYIYTSVYGIVAGYFLYKKNGTEFVSPFSATVTVFGPYFLGIKIIGSGIRLGAATAASSNPHVVGYLDDGAAGPYRAFRFDAETEALDELGTLDAADTAAFSFARGITNDASVVVGYSDIPSSVFLHAFRWTEAGGMKDLDTGETGLGSRAFDVSGDGDTIVGDRAGQAVRWVWNGTTATHTDLTNGTATAVTGNGSAIAGFHNGPDVAFRWTQATGAVDLGTVSGHTSSAALGISDNGKIVVGVSQASLSSPDFNGVGGGLRFDPPNARAFRWTDPLQGGNGMEDLNDVLADAGIDLTGITLVAVTGISPDGQFLTGEMTTPDTVGTETVSFVAQVCDEFIGGECFVQPSDNDLLADFGAPGLWVLQNNATWKKLHPASPMHIGSGDLDGSAQDEAITSFAGAGLWARFNDTTWVKLHNGTPQRFATGDLDGSGKDDLIVDFGGAGLWVRYNNATWAKRHNAPTQEIATGDLDGNGKDELIVDFGGAGLWVRYNNTTWVKLHNASPSHIATGDLDGSGKDELIAAFGGAGLWVRYNNATWAKRHNAQAQLVATGDLDGNGEAELLVDFGSAGLWARYNDATWKKLHNASPQRMVTADLDGSGKDEAVVDFGSAGLWARYNDTTWLRLHTASPQEIAAGGFD